MKHFLMELTYAINKKTFDFSNPQTVSMFRENSMSSLKQPSIVRVNKRYVNFPMKFIRSFVIDFIEIRVHCARSLATIPIYSVAR